MIGSMVAHYRITDKIGAGGMGIVYRAEDTRLARVVALKFLSPSAMSDSDRQRFLQEARASAGIQHPNVCPIFEINEHEGQPFFAMAFVSGKTISQLLESGPLPASKALDIAIQVAAGLEAAHRLGIIHRDIKSGNIMVGPDGHVTILDFGLALAPNSERLTISGAASGTASYMSPEQAQGLAIDARTDLWSLGVVLFEMLTGALPFRGSSLFGVMTAIVNQEPESIFALRPQAAAPIADLLGKALAKDVNLRWQTATEMGSAMRRIGEAQSRQTQTVASIKPITPGDGKPLTSRTTAPAARGWKIAAAALALIVLLAGGYFAFRQFGGGDLPAEKQIAILPFTIIGDQSDQAVRAIADGLVETLTAKLSQVEDFQGRLLVVPASEIRSRKIATAEEARRIYGINLAITGSAQRWGDKIQFNEVLVNAETVRQLGATSFELILDKATEIRDSSIEGVMRLLRVKLTPATASAIDAGETAGPAAYGDYLKGIGYLARYDVNGNVDRAIGSLENAISSDPKYALAHAALGEAHWRKAKLSSDKNEAALALSSIRLAIELDSKLTSAHIKLGEIYSESGQADLAISEEKNALQLAPCNSQAYRALGNAYAATSRFGEAETAYQKSVSCQPADWYGHSQLGFFYVQRGRLKDARTAYETARALTPDNEVVRRNLASLDMRDGKFQDAINLMKTSQADARSYAVLGLAYFYQHQFQSAAAALNSSLKLAPEVYQTWGNLGSVYQNLPAGDAKARQCFQKAADLANKTLEVLHGDFRAHANLAEYYAKLGDGKKALAELAQIPESARGPFIDRVILVYVFTGQRQRAVDAARSVPENSPVINYMKNDPGLSGLWDPTPAH